MTIELPDQELGSLKLTGEQARLSLAVGLYTERKVTLGRAAKIAGIPYTEFMQELGKYGVCVNYTMEDLLQDITTVRQRRRS
jgi:predicted HTH domain antitoxin